MFTVAQELHFSSSSSAALLISSRGTIRLSTGGPVADGFIRLRGGLSRKLRPVQLYDITIDRPAISGEHVFNIAE